MWTDWQKQAYKSSATSASESASSASISSKSTSLSVLRSGSESALLWSATESALLWSASESTLGLWSSGSWGFAFLGESVHLQEVFWVDVQDLVLLERWGIDTFGGFDAEVEVTDRAEYLVNSTNLGLVFEINAPVEFGKSRHISTLDNELILASMQEGAIRDDKGGRSLIKLPEVSTSSSSAASWATSLSSSLPKSATSVIALEFSTHF